MTKRRWKCYSGIKEKIYSIIKSNKDLTTRGICIKLTEQKIKVTWNLVDSFLVELESEKKIKRIRIGDKHKINFWNLF